MDPIGVRALGGGQSICLVSEGLSDFGLTRTRATVKAVADALR